MPEQKTQVSFLKGSGVSLRMLVKSDLPLLIKWRSDPEIMRYLDAYLPLTEEEENDWFENLYKRKSQELVLMIIVNGDMPIGTIGLNRINYKDGTATTGTVIGEKDYWDMERAEEGKMLLLDYAFNTLNLRKICSNVIEFNERSYEYNLKCGYAEEGRRKKQLYREGEYWDEIFMAVFKENWLPLWEKFKKTSMRWK